ncbi:nitrogen regulation protein NR(I) [Solilutibacter silvestris]|uniref:nitrogen regulation protein NR(I) n=1 Tax=Solilutibacter silvestris TaxID=1645665 RepID=UPI003D335004
MQQPELWVVDDDASVRFVLATALRDAGHQVREFADGASAWSALQQAASPPALLFTDVRMPGDDGLKLLERIKGLHAELPVVVMSAHTDVSSTAGAFRGGAYEFLSKPFDLDDAVMLAARVLDTPTVDAEVVPESPQAPLLIGDTPAMQALFRSIGRVAQAPLNVLITGETGTGKELVARAIHLESPRAARPFVALNTAAIPAELLESELFGHEAGAFTGAARRHVGRFEQADGGTLFLDEIGDMPAPLQTRLLRVLAEGEFFRVGGRELIRVDVRIIAATHQPLEQLVVQGRFRADLLHRLDVVRLAIPPLRERRDDIPRLAEGFLQRAAQRLDVAPKRFTRAALQKLQAHDWPGNVRELENLCWRLAAMAPDARIGVDDLQLTTLRTQAAGADWERALADWARSQLAMDVDDLHARARERFDTVLLQAALDATDGHRGHAADRLGLGRNTVTRKLGSSRTRRK